MIELKCEIVQDLLPMYVEDLVSEETKKMITSHLEECKDCQSVYSRMDKNIKITPVVPKPDKKVLLYIYSVRLWYLFCPLLALTFIHHQLHYLWHLYEGFLILFSVICISSQFFSGLTSYGFDMEQANLQQEVLEAKAKKLGKFNVTPFALCFPALLVIGIVELPKLVMFLVGYF